MVASSSTATARSAASSRRGHRTGRRLPAPPSSPSSVVPPCTIAPGQEAVSPLALLSSRRHNAIATNVSSRCRTQAGRKPGTPGRRMPVPVATTSSQPRYGKPGPSLGCQSCSACGRGHQALRCVKTVEHRTPDAHLSLVIHPRLFSTSADRLRHEDQHKTSTSLEVKLL